MKIIKVSKASSSRMRSGDIEIKFYSNDSHNVGDVVSLDYDGRKRYFKINEVFTDTGKYLYYTASEYGYYTIIKGSIDLRKLYDLDVEIVTDEERLKELSQESRFC